MLNNSYLLTKFQILIVLNFLLLGAIFLVAPIAKADTLPSGAFDNFNLATGTVVQTTGDLNVRETPSKTGAFIAVKPRGSRGMVVAGPKSMDGYIWYKVDYEIGASGWNVANWLERMTKTNIKTGTSTAAITSLTATPMTVGTTSEIVSLAWETMGVNRCWLYNSANYVPVYDIDPHASHYNVTPQWSINRTQIVYTLNCLDVMATDTTNLISKTVSVSLGSSTARLFATSSVDYLGLAVGTPVLTTGILNTRSTPSVYGAFIGTKPSGSRGTITQGPSFADGRYWYFVDYEIGVDGWNASGWLSKRLSTSTTMTYGTSTISSFTVDKMTVDATNTPVTLNWHTQNVLKCVLTNSSDLSLPPIIDNAPANGSYSMTPNWRNRGSNSTSITFTLRCQDTNASVKKLVEQSVKVNFTGAVKASGNITAITTGTTPTISGTAYGTGIVGLTISKGNNVVSSSTNITVNNNQWTKTVSPALNSGNYVVKLYSDGLMMGTKTFKVASSTTN